MAVAPWGAVIGRILLSYIWAQWGHCYDKLVMSVMGARIEDSGTSTKQ